MSENKIKSFAKEHKTEIAIAVGAVMAVGLTYLGIKYIPQISQVQIQSALKTGGKAATFTARELPIKNVVNNLTGESLTPSKLGNEVFQSARQINKRLVNCGLQERLPCGEYKLTELGKKFGNMTLKLTKAGHTFSNIEWDKRVLDIIFSEDEIKHIIDMKENILKTNIA